MKIPCNAGRTEFEQKIKLLAVAYYIKVVLHLTHAVEVAAVALNASGVTRAAVRAGGWVQAGTGVVEDAVLVHGVVRPGLEGGGGSGEIYCLEFLLTPWF